MSIRETKREIENVPNLLRRDVFAFCLMLLGDGPAAEEATCQAFVALQRQRGFELQPGEVSAQLLKLALFATKRIQIRSIMSEQTGASLAAAIQLLPFTERAVVILRSLLRTDWASVAVVTELSQTQAHKVWTRAIFQLNELLQKRSLSKEHH